MKFLLDECLSPELTKAAISRGYSESSHVVWLGHGGAKDWQLKAVIVDGDWTFVTKNSVDFRGPSSRPGTSGQYAAIMLHAGLVCLNAPAGMDLDMQVELFEEALNELARNNDLVNQVLEVSADGEEFHILRYNLPP